jgi:hypothetical protein
MKKSILNLAAGMAVILSASSASYAQKDVPMFNIKDSKNLENVVAMASPGTSSVSGSSSMNDRAIHEFNKSFKNVANVKWSKISDGFLASFTGNRQTTRVYFDRKGILNYTVKCYDESQLPRDVRSQVKSVYYDYKITLVEEIEGGGKSTFIIHLEGEDTWKNVRIADGEMDVIEDLKKAQP